MGRSLTTRSAAAALLAVFAPAAATAQVIVGRVIDAASGNGVAGATITAEGPYSPRALSGADGRFSIALGEAGSYRVRAARQGYRGARSRLVSVGPGDTVSVELRIAAAPVALRALEVTARKRPVEVTGRFHQVHRPDSTDASSARGEGRWRAIGVRGTFATPNVCHQLAAVADRTGPVVTLVVEARPGGFSCSDAPGAFTYSITLRDLPSGAYTLRVFHALRTRPGEREMSLDTTVTVR